MLITNDNEGSIENTHALKGSYWKETANSTRNESYII